MEEVTIGREFYNQLLADQKQLLGLLARGVDNWEGYSEDSDDDESYEDIYGEEK